MGCGASKASSGRQDAGTVDPGGKRGQLPLVTQQRPSTDTPGQPPPQPPSAGSDLTSTPASSLQQPQSSIDSPVRLLIVDSFAKFTEAVPCYEHLPAKSYIDVAFEDYLENRAYDTAVISWRWARPKPPDLQTAASAEACPVPVPLVEYVVGRAREDEIKYLWLDWSCAPQYPQDLGATMREINRSGQYYANSRGFYVWCFAARVEPDDFQHSDYFCRAWTLSERLHRAKAKAALRAQDFLPSYLDTLFTMPLDLLDAPQWATLMRHSVIIPLEVASAVAGVDAVVLRTVSRAVVKRTPLLDRVVSAIEGPLRSVLRPDVLAALRGCAVLHALVSWTATPCALSDGMLDAFGYNPLKLKEAMLRTTVDDIRKVLNNYASDLHAEVLVGPGVFEAWEMLGTGFAQGAMLLLKPAGELWQRALTAPTAESAVSPEWLRVYLVFEAGRAYQAFAAPDLLFAIYKLFLTDNYSYGQEAELYGELVRVAQCKWLAKPEAGPYDWLKELADLTDDETGVVSSLLEAAPNSRKDPTDAVSPVNFGVFTLGRQPPRQYTPLSIPDLFCMEDYSRDNIFTHVLGLYLDPTAQQALAGRKNVFTLVDKAVGGDIDTHLSLRGRESLGRFEAKLHAAVAAVCAQPWADENCGIFIIVRYGTMMCLSKCVVLRASGQMGDTSGSDGGREWVVENLAAFGSEAQKGSSWGIAQSLQLLVEDVFSLPGLKSAAYKAFGTADIAVGLFEVEELKSEHLATPDQAPWFSSFRVALEAKREMPEPAPPPPPEEQAPSSPSRPGSSSSRAAATAAAADSGVGTETPTALMALLGSIPGQKDGCGFDDAELKRVEAAYNAMVHSGFSRDGMTVYYEALSRNYVHDSEMAKQLGYYAKLCIVYARHLKESGATLMQVHMMREKFKYMEEDLGDAINMADDDDASKDAARTALGGLSAALEALKGAGGGSDSD